MNKDRVTNICVSKDQHVSHSGKLCDFWWCLYAFLAKQTTSALT